MRTRDFQQFLSEPEQRESRHFLFFNCKPLQFILKKDDISKITPGSELRDQTLDIKSRKKRPKKFLCCKKNINNYFSSSSIPSSYGKI